MDNPLRYVLTGLLLFAGPAFSQPNQDIATLPLEAQASISAALGRNLSGFAMAREGVGYKAVNRNQDLSAEFDRRGVTVHDGAWVWSMAVRAYGYGDGLEPAAAVTPEAHANRIEYRRGGLAEWYANGPIGVEQGFTLRRPPAAHADARFTIALTLQGDLSATLDRDRLGVSLSAANGQAALRYGRLSAYDRDGKQLTAWMEMRGAELWLRTDTAGAQYPIVIDPIVQRAKLTAADGAVHDLFGTSVAVSGNTVVVGAPYHSYNGSAGTGAAYVFVKSGSGWTNMTQTAELLASDGVAGDYFGSSVAIAGSTVVVGAPYASDYRGAIYVFVEPAGGWVDMTQTAKLTNDRGGDLGFSVAVSANARTVVGGAFSFDGDQGAAFVFVEPPHGWKNTPRAAQLTASDGTNSDYFGYSVSISGNTIVAGAPGSVNPGAAYVFVEPAGGWADMTETAKLTGTDVVTLDSFGESVAISGGTVAVGAPQHPVTGNQPGPGAIYVFTEPEGGWTSTTQTAELTASDGFAFDDLGYSVSINGDFVAAGAPFHSPGLQYQGAAYVFEKPAGGWKDATQNSEVHAAKANAGDTLGWSVANGNGTLVAGAPECIFVCANGAAYVFTYKP